MALEPSGPMEHAQRCWSSPKHQLLYLWITIIFFGFIYSLVAIAAAVSNSGHHLSSSRSLGFVGVWSMLMVAGLSVGGTMVMRRYKTRFAVGFLLGVVLMMAFQMLSLSVMFAGTAVLGLEERKKEGHSTNVAANNAGAVFSTVLFLLYLAFAFALYKHREVVIAEPQEHTSSRQAEPVVPYNAKDQSAASTGKDNMTIDEKLQVNSV